jgi:hypothetical protein
MRASVVGMSDSVLLNDEISDYLQEIRKTAVRLQTIKSTIKSLPGGEQRAALVDRI